jgi:hypothetical protein
LYVRWRPLDRKSLLNEIMRIDGRISSLRRDNRYLTIKRDLGYLETRRYGQSMVSVVSPDDVEKSLEIRINSPLMRETITRYRKILNDFDVQMDRLHMEKAKLQEQLFK